ESDTMESQTFIRGIVAAGALLCATTPLLATGTLIPEQFQGMWQSVDEGQVPSCKTNDADSMLTVKPDRIDFHEGGCDILSVDAPSADAGALSLDLMCGGEGEIWSSKQVWKSTANGGRPALVVTDRRDDGDFSYLYGQCTTLRPAGQLDARSYCYS